MKAGKRSFQTVAILKKVMDAAQAYRKIPAAAYVPALARRAL